LWTCKTGEEVLVKDLGHKVTEPATGQRGHVEESRHQHPEELFEEVYRGQKKDLL